MSQMLPKIPDLKPATIRDYLSKMTPEAFRTNSRFRFRSDDVWRDGNGNPSPLPASHPASGAAAPNTAAAPMNNPTPPSTGYCIWEWKNTSPGAPSPTMAWVIVTGEQHCTGGLQCKSPRSTSLMAEGTQVVIDC